MLPRISGNSSLFQAGSEQGDVIFLFTCCNSSGYCLFNLRASRRKLVLFSLHLWAHSLVHWIVFKPLEICSLHKYFGVFSAYWILQVFHCLHCVDLRAPVMILDAWFCTLLTLSNVHLMLFLMQPQRTQELIELVQHIFFLYSAICSAGGSRQILFLFVFFISVVRSLALAVHLSICCFHVILGSNAIPRWVGVLSCGSTWPYYQKNVLSVLLWLDRVLCRLFFLALIVTSLFSVFLFSFLFVFLFV